MLMHHPNHSLASLLHLALTKAQDETSRAVDFLQLTEFHDVPLHLKNAVELCGNVELMACYRI